ncbi:MAG TPA: hypothetical protein VGP82_12385 [Ktedonobacterales bacterium]|jgi:hypothetical protein|nr:hypothetical protein [Ktedonobacterales bacterium]
MASQTCLRCGALCDEDATVCFTCGAPLGEVKTPTQPVPIPKLPKHEPDVEPAPQATPPAATGAIAILKQPKSEVETPIRKRRWPVFVLFGMLALALLGGGGYLLRALLAGPPVANTVVYHDPQQRFHFTRPNLWVLTAAQDGVLLTDSAGTSRLQLTISVPQKGEDAIKHADTLATAEALTAVAPQTYAGETWEQRTGVVTGNDGVVRQELLLVTVHGGQLYTIECAAPLSGFDSTNNLVFQPLLTSFTFDK